MGETKDGCARRKRADALRKRLAHQQRKDEFRAARKARFEADPERQRALWREKHLRNRERNLIRMRTRYAIKKGWLRRRPCEGCGTEDRVEAHHNDYMKPFDVSWLCAKCHAIQHRKYA